MKILVTGATGQLGRALQPALRKHEVLARDHRRLDITALATVREAIESTRPHLVINAAAFNDVDGAESAWEPAYRVNALGPRNLAVATAGRGIPILHVSTDYVFDGTSTRPYHEFDRPNPLNVYGASKLAGECAVAALNPRHFIVRTAWLYDSTGRNFPLTMCALAKNQAAVRVVDDQRGCPTYAPHLAEAIAHLITSDAFGIFHLAGQGSATWFELTKRLYAELRIETPVHPVATAEFPRPAKRPARSVLTTLQEPRVLLPPWEEGVAEFARALRASGVS
jgi:dTDP-4-dehydrorhamnose reductase